MNTAAVPSRFSHEASEALGLWEPTRTLTLEAARRHTVRIMWLRRILIALALFIVAILFWQFARQAPSVFPDDNPNDSVKMINPRYSGRTADGLPYKLTADFATRERQANDAVALDKPVLNFYRTAGAAMSTIVAQDGQYDDVNKILNLRQAVRLKTDDGYDCTTSHARIFAREKRIEGDERIECEGAFGEVNGNAYEINENYTVFVFKNKMDAILEQDVSAATEGGQ